MAKRNQANKIFICKQYVAISFFLFSEYWQCQFLMNVSVEKYEGTMQHLTGACVKNHLLGHKS